MNNFMLEIKNKSHLLHKATEISGFTHRFLAKGADLESYTEYIYNLSFVYEAIENYLNKYKDLEDVKPFVTTELFRTEAIKNDVKELSNNKDLEILSSTLAYVDKLNTVAEINPKLLIPHAYVRFLADLFGGRMFYSLLKEEFNVSDEALKYYSYEDLGDIKAYVMKYHMMLAKLNLNEEEQKQFIIEVSNSYIYNISISNELDAKYFAK
ncbi:biliverdin-producing heme oxygenase [Clostridium sp. AL.422]|uniref:biliverdin-producing heme oxygenase n=1 Tax=Clostridium TaxID=1485 RepID=UPI00293DDCBB|nr:MULTISPECIES: biliverdin-producing heme oxygenase [unclassified Clostridium]MDV4150609.1 biliverdin-producing heme oxygenase [Clostridium sp. AL.422]